MRPKKPSAIDCPNCVDGGAVEEIEAMTEEMDVQTLDAFVGGRDEWQKTYEIVGFLLRPCGHQFPLSDWLLITDEHGTRLHDRKRVLIIHDNGEVLPA